MATLLLALAILWSSAAAPARAADEADQSLAANLTHLADAGQFDQLLATLKTGPFDPSQPRVASLIDHLARFQRDRQAQTAERQEAYQKSLAKMAEETQKDELEKALFTAAEAYSLAIDKKAMFTEPVVVAVVEKARAAGQKAETESQWLDALNLYRALDMLFEVDGLYRGDVKRVTHHVRVLRIYAPKKLEELYTQRAARLGDEDPEPLNLDNEDWGRMLADVDMPMLRQALVQIARHHVDNHGYRPLVLGAVEALAILVRTDGLEPAFPGMADAAKRDAMLKDLTAIDQQLQADAGADQPDLRYLEVERMIARIEDVNDRTVNLPRSVLAYELTQGATDTLDDYSTVIWPNELPELYRTLQGNFPGVGILLSVRDGRLVVVSPLLDTPAMRGGVRAGDIIATVDGAKTDTWSINKAVDEITGPEGTEVELGIVRTGVPELLKFKLTRATIKIDSIRGWEWSDAGGWNYYIDPDLRIGYVRLTQFIPQTADDLDAAVNQMEKDGPLNGLILDLRFNPGGLLRSAVDVVDRFINAGTIVSTVDVKGEEQEKHSASPMHTYDTFPVVVIINQGSASASEIVAGALQDYHRALILGARSFGKGSVQDMFHVQGDKALLKLTTQYYRLPSNRIIHRRPKAAQWGIEPDLIVDVTDQQVADALKLRQELDVVHAADEQPDPNNPPHHVGELLDHTLDPQLDAALLVLKTRLVTQDIGLAQRPEKTGQPLGTQ